MARYDKYDGVTGGFRGKLAAAWPASDKGKVYGVSLDGSGNVVKGGAVTAVVGVVIVNEAHAAGDIIDVMTSGEIADFNFLNDGTTATVAGTVYYADATTGAPTNTSNTGANKRIGQVRNDAVSGRGMLTVRVVQS